MLYSYSRALHVSISTREHQTTREYDVVIICIRIAIQPLKYYQPNASSSFIRQKLTQQKFALYGISTGSSGKNQVTGKPKIPESRNPNIMKLHRWQIGTTVEIGFFMLLIFVIIINFQVKIFNILKPID